MTKRAFRMQGDGLGLIESRVLHKARNKKCKRDIINLRCTASDGLEFIDCDINPEEAIVISNALTRAWIKWKLKDVKVRKSNPSPKDL